MDCQEARELLDSYALGALAEREIHALEEHLEECSRCRGELEEASHVAALLGLAVPIVRPRPALRRRVLAQARRPALPRLRWLWPGLAAASAAASVALAALALLLYTQVQDMRVEQERLRAEIFSTRELAREHTEMVSLVSLPDLRLVPMFPSPQYGDARATYYWSESKRWGFVAAVNLPDPPPGRVYQLWYLRDGEAHSGDTFLPRNGTAYHAFDLSRLPGGWRPTEVTVTLEPEGGSSQPTTPPVLSSSPLPR